ncbi:hypothetical protein K0038_02593 [Pseudomonas syringae]|uniref:hypothetical protein n=1 Tax=Pseudomonas syringae TaxID=317 RepID=UPI001CA7C7D9|nr:hypothetical protein [Pseudomonas syringae]MCI3945551.1 hypothetical protein [Pseudomonas syringae]
MKKCLFLSMTLAALYSANACASVEDDCLLYDTAAKGAMETRQRGVALADVMKIINKNKGKIDSPEAELADKAVRKAFLEAYQTPKYGTEKMQQESVNEFRNKYYSECLSANSNS